MAKYRFRDCLRSATEVLATGPEYLRGRLESALLSLCFCEAEDVPDDLRERYGWIRGEVVKRAGEEIDIQLLHRTVSRMNSGIARRIAREILELDRLMAAKERR
jgi:hypothetical protein